MSRALDVLIVEDSKNDAAVVRSTINLAHDPGLKASAEGAEMRMSWRQFHRLLGRGKCGSFLRSTKTKESET